MAKRKTQAEEIDETPVNSVVTEESEGSNITPTSETEVVEPENSVEAQPETKVRAKKAPKQEIPDNVLEVLKTFSNYPELLVTPQGCVYTPDCKLAASKAAILYKNPYYNS